VGVGGGGWWGGGGGGGGGVGVITDKNKRPSLISILDNIYCVVLYVSAYL
jgi:hypothetical protein